MARLDAHIRSPEERRIMKSMMTGGNNGGVQGDVSNRAPGMATARGMDQATRSVVISGLPPTLAIQMSSRWRDTCSPISIITIRATFLI